VLSAVRTTGPLTPRQIKDETGLLNKQIMPALHQLQEAFVVFEDQLDSDWDRGWSSFASEWPDVVVSEAARDGATRRVLRRFLAAHVFATFEQVRDWSRWPVRRLRSALAELEAAAVIEACQVDGLGDGWAPADDASLPSVADAGPSVFMLHKADFLCRSHTSELKRAFGDLEVLQWLLIDGRFRGAVLGHWRIGPHDADDIVVDLPHRDRAQRRDEIVAAVAQQYHAPRSHILKYDGQDPGTLHG
jgi:hypothetical protein